MLVFDVFVNFVVFKVVWVEIIEVENDEIMFDKIVGIGLYCVLDGWLLVIVFMY